MSNSGRLLNDGVFWFCFVAFVAIVRSSSFVTETDRKRWRNGFGIVPPRPSGRHESCLLFWFHSVRWHEELGSRKWSWRFPWIKSVLLSVRVATIQYALCCFAWGLGRHSVGWFCLCGCQETNDGVRVCPLVGYVSGCKCTVAAVVTELYVSMDGLVCPGVCRIFYVVFFVERIRTRSATIPTPWHRQLLPTATVSPCGSTSTGSVWPPLTCPYLHLLPATSVG